MKLGIVDGWLKNNLDRLANSFYPSCCVLCAAVGLAGRDLCNCCEALLPFQDSACPQCAAVLTQTSLLCGNCLKNPPLFDRSYALFRYQEPVSSLIHKLKFNARLVYARLLSDLWLQRYRDQIRMLPECIIPVPLHASRLRKRGFNQALVLAEPIAKALGIPLDMQHCVRIRNTDSQTGLAISERRTNLYKAFALKPGLKAKRVALLDDVMTTGSTVEALAAVLKEGGVEQVDVWVMARTVK